MTCARCREETLAQYESIEVDAMMVVVTPRVRELLARYPIQIDCMNTIDLDDETTLNTINGKTLFTGRNTPTAASS